MGWGGRGEREQEGEAWWQEGGWSRNLTSLSSNLEWQDHDFWKKKVVHLLKCIYSFYIFGKRGGEEECLDRREEVEEDSEGQREWGKDGGARTDHRISPPTKRTLTYTHSAVRGSPAVHVDHNNTPEKWNRRESMRRRSEGKREDWCGIRRERRVERGMEEMEGENEGEEGRVSNNLRLWELRREIGRSEFSVWLLQMLQVHIKVSELNTS